jgi:hypothetical protein
MTQGMKGPIVQMGNDTEICLSDCLTEVNAKTGFNPIREGD